MIKKKLPKSVAIFPYFENKVLLVSASLNGGNVLEKFLETIENWFIELDFDLKSNNRDQLWEKIIKIGHKYLLEKIQPGKNEINCVPKLFGERHDMQSFASFDNIRLDNLSLGAVFNSICNGLVKNLKNMITLKLIKEELGCERIIGTGSALIRNPILKHYLELEFNCLNIEYKESCDAAIGASHFLKDLYS